MRLRAVPGGVAILIGLMATASCSQPPCATLEDVARCAPPSPALARPAALPRAASEYRLYIDRSGSMAGYLDTAYAGPFGVRRGSSSLRRQLEMFLGAPGATAVQVFGFGERVVPVRGASSLAVIGELVRRDFYGDNDTRLEQVLDAVAADTERAAVHLIITDGRRASGAAEIAQYGRMAQVARWWLAGGSAGGGLFAVAVSSAPFHQVRSDRAGCWAEGGGEQREPLHCPLYTFAFIPGRSAGPALELLRRNASRLFVTPAPPAALRLELAPMPSAGGVLNAFNGPPLHLYFRTVSAQLVRDSAPVSASLREGPARFAMDDSLWVRVQSARIEPGPGGGWSAVTVFANSWVKPGTPRRDTSADRLLVPVELRAHRQVPATRYRVEVLSAGRPGWLGEFEATRQGEPVRTYGLSALFDQLPEVSRTLGLFYVSIY